MKIHKCTILASGFRCDIGADCAPYAAEQALRIYSSMGFAITEKENVLVVCPDGKELTYEVAVTNMPVYTATGPIEWLRKTENQ